MSAATVPPPETEEQSAPADAKTPSMLDLVLRLTGMGMSMIPCGGDKKPCVKWKAY